MSLKIQEIDGEIDESMEIQERTRELSLQESLKWSLEEEVKSMKRDFLAIESQKNSYASSYYETSKVVGQSNMESEQLRGEKANLENGIQRIRIEKRKWSKYIEHVDATIQAERENCQKFLDEMKKKLEKMNVVSELESKLQSERDFIAKVLKPQHDQGARTLKEAKEEIQETKMILLDMEKRKNVLGNQLRQAQHTRDQILRREEKARASLGFINTIEHGAQ